MQNDAPTQRRNAADLAKNFDLLSLPEDFYDSPFPYYQALQEHSPVKQLSDGSFFLTHYADLIGIYKNTTLFSSDKKTQFKPKNIVVLSRHFL